MILDYLEIKAVTQLMVLGTETLPEPWTSTSFPEIRYPRLGKGEKEGLCVCVILKDFSIFNEDIKSLL